MDRFYEYGGMKNGQNTKLHICNDLGVVFCGVKSNWMEAGEPINDKGFIQDQEHLPSIHNSHTCKKCLKKFNNQTT